MNLKPLTILGLVGTAVWLSMVAVYVATQSDWVTFKSLPLNSVGDFVAGITAPLAFWWLVLGYFQQGIELRQNVQALEQQSKETANLVVQAQAQSDTIKANELHARRDTFLRYAELIVSDMQFKSLQLLLTVRTQSWGQFNSIGIQKSHDAYFSGDKDAPVRRLLMMITADGGSLRNSIGVNQTAGRLIERLLEDFRSLLREASAADGPGRSLLGFYESSLYGDLYAVICFVLMQDAGFVVRSPLSSVDEVII